MKKQPPKPKIKVLIFDGEFKFGSQNFGKDEKAATDARDKYYNNGKKV